jgi:hypothetical protein
MLLYNITCCLRRERGIVLLFAYPHCYKMVGGKRQTLATLPQEQPQYPLLWGLAGPPSSSGWVREISPQQDLILRPSSL